MSCPAFGALLRAPRRPSEALNLAARPVVELTTAKCRHSCCKGKVVLTLLTSLLPNRVVGEWRFPWVVSLKRVAADGGFEAANLDRRFLPVHHGHVANIRRRSRRARRPLKAQQPLKTRWS